MSSDVALDAKACGRILLGSDTSNKHLEWIGHRQLSAMPPRPFACHRGSVSPT